MSDARTVLPVSLLVSSARLLLERHIGLVWVSGEISGFTRAASGHCYFKLKDAQAQVSCVFFRHKAQFTDFAPEDGLAVEIRATASLYEARGEFQLNVETMRLAGQGALYEKFARLKARLDAQGWFAPERKRALPAFPAAVGIVTSMRAAALADILTTLARRWPALRVVIYPTSVQGEGAAAEIAQAIRNANTRAEVDVLIVGRGGGSIEDLWAFNEEIVAQAVFDSALPIVSAVGHETDFTICDFVADARAPTPTAAAALVAPDRMAVARDVIGFRQRWQRAALRAVEVPMQRLDALERRLVHPAARIATQARAAGALAQRMVRAFSRRQDAAATDAGSLGKRLLLQLRQPLPQTTRLLRTGGALVQAVALARERTERRVDALGQGLALLNPEATLLRGYAIVANATGAIVTRAADVKEGDEVAIRFAHGGAGAKIINVRD